MAERKGRGGGRSKGGSRGRSRGSGDGAPVRPFWSGTISFGLVTVPVALWPANRAGGAPLRMLAPDGTPLERRFFCPKEEREVPREEIVRGYELDGAQDESGKSGKGGRRFVEVSDEELEGLAPERSREIDLRRFVDRDALDPAFFQRAYFLTPGGDSTKAYRLLAAAMEAENRAGIATFVMRGKEYLVAILAEDGILRAETLRFNDEIRSPKAIGLPEPAKPPAKAVQAMRKAIRDLAEDAIDRDELVDRDTERLLAVVEAKREEGEDVVGSEPAARGAEVVAIGDHVDLMEAIRRSLQREEGGDGASGRRAAAKAKAKGSGKAKASGGSKGNGRSKGNGKEKAGGRRGELAGMSKEELYARAQEMELAGRGSMTKAELVEALGGG